MKTKDIRDLISKQRECKASFNQKLEAIENDKYLSSEGKTIKKNEARANYEKETYDRGKIIENMLMEYKSGYKGGVKLDDSVLSNLLILVNTLGKDTPSKALQEATLHYRSNQDMLNVISDIVKAKEIPFAIINNFITDDVVIDDAILEARKGIDNVSSLSPIGIAMAHIESVEGASFPTENISPSPIPLIF